MDEFQIQFDPDKAKENFRKHGVRLADGEGVLYDPLMLHQPEEDHEEERFIATGNDGAGNVLVIVYAYRDPNIIRLISARKATRKEIAEYEAG